MEMRPGSPCSEDDENTVRKRRAVLEQQLNEFKPGLCLDAGCGVGVYFPLYESHGSRVIGVDISHAHLRTAKRQVGREHSQLAAMSLEALGFSDGAFDFIACIETLEHIKKDQLALSEFRRLTKPGGLLLLTVPFRGFPFETHSIRIGSRDVSSLMGLGIPLLTYFPGRIRESFATVHVYSVKHLSRLLRERGFHPRRIRFLMPALDIFERKLGSSGLPGLLRRFFNWCEHRLAGVWGSTLVVVAEAVEDPRDGNPGQGETGSL